METIQMTSSVFMEEKSGYLKINRSKIKNLEKMIELLNKRKELITSIVGDDIETLGEEYEQNEKLILLLKTDYDLSNHHKKRIALEKESAEYLVEAIKVCDEMNHNWNEVIAKAKRDAVNKKDIGAILESMNSVDLEENIDIKLNYYIQLKSMVYNTGTNKMRKVD